MVAVDDGHLRGAIRSRPLGLLISLIVAVAAGGLYWQFSTPSHFTEPVLLAQAMIHGHLWIDAPPWIEHFQYGGRTYLVQPPGPALLLLPEVWLYRTANQGRLAAILGGLGVGLAYQLAGREKSWLAAFFGLGTIYAWAVTDGSSWQIALTGSVPFSLLAIQLEREGWPLAVGLCAGAAGLFRYDLVLAWPFYGWLLRKQLYRYELGLLPFALGLLWFNWARLGNPFTTDLAIYAAADPQAHGLAPFRLAYLPTNLNVLLFMPPYLNGDFPFIHPHFGGQALIWTSPAFLGALRVREWGARVAMLWLMAIAVSIPSLTVYADGYVQFGARYFIQAYPFLFALLAIHAEEDGLDRLDKLLIGLSIFLVLEGMFCIRVYGWGW